MMSTFDKQVFGKRLQEMRIKAGYARQLDLAAKIGTVVTTISNYESGKRLPDAEMLARIVEALPCNADYLLGFEDKPTYSEAFISKNTGLTNESIARLSDFASHYESSESIMRTINYLLGSEVGFVIMSWIESYFELPHNSGSEVSIYFDGKIAYTGDSDSDDELECSRELVPFVDLIDIAENTIFERLRHEMNVAKQSGFEQDSMKAEIKSIGMLLEEIKNNRIKPNEQHKQGV